MGRRRITAKVERFKLQNTETHKFKMPLGPSIYCFHSNTHDRITQKGLLPLELAGGPIRPALVRVTRNSAHKLHVVRCSCRTSACFQICSIFPILSSSWRGCLRAPGTASYPTMSGQQGTCWEGLGELQVKPGLPFQRPCANQIPCLHSFNGCLSCVRMRGLVCLY